MTKKVLILGVASVQLDAINQLSELNIEVHAVAMRKDGPGADAADYFTEINILDIEKIIDYIKENKIDCVYSTGSDLAMPVACEVSERLSLPHFISRETATVCNKKDRMRETLGGSFEGNAQYQILNNADQEITLDYPFILKPTDSQGQRGVELVYNTKQYQAVFNTTKQFSRQGLVIAEQYISGPEVSVNGYLVNGKLEFMVVSDRKTWSEYTGLIHKHVVPSADAGSNMNNKIYKLLESASKKLGIDNGPVYAQVKLEHDSPYIIEITPRLDGCHMWKLLTFSHGINLMKLTLEHLLFNKTSELNKLSSSVKPHTLEFICQKPETLMLSQQPDVLNENVIFSFNYYKEGERVRPVNGKYDKVGYVIYPHADESVS